MEVGVHTCLSFFFGSVDVVGKISMCSVAHFLFSLVDGAVD